MPPKRQREQASENECVKLRSSKRLKAKVKNTKSNYFEGEDEDDEEKEEEEKNKKKTSKKSKLSKKSGKFESQAANKGEKSKKREKYEDTESDISSDEKWKPKKILRKPKPKKKSNYFESNQTKSKAGSKKKSEQLEDQASEASSDEDEEEDWEEVEDAVVDDDVEELMKNYHPELPEKGIDIVLELPRIGRKKKQKVTADELIRLQINRVKKESQVNIQKTHLLCLFASGLYLNSLTKSKFISSLALSHMSDLNFNFEKVSIRMMHDFSKWFRCYFVQKESESPSINFKLALIKAFQTRSISSDLEYVLMYLTCARLWLPKVQFRLCFAISPMSGRPTNLLLSDKQRERQETSKKSIKIKARLKKQIEKEKKKGKKKETQSASSEVKESKEKSKVVELWIEFYNELERRWICIEPVNNIVDQPKKIQQLTYDPLVYVIAYNNGNFVKEVTARYSADWCTNKLQKLRAGQEWWERTLKCFMSKKLSEADELEDQQLEEDLSSKPLPLNISDYKNHPLYVLTRHLLKYEVLYPPNPPPIGYFKGEPVYSRECVKTVHTKEHWKKQAKVIKPFEEPYKVSVSRKKWDKNCGALIGNLPQPLYGEWQTEPYIPPTAKDGKVPRSEYGNVELFQPCMLPFGCVHLCLPGLLRIANKLKIDCAPAVVGFTVTGGGGIIPVFDGFVVCEEYRDVLVDAWVSEDERQRSKERSVKERRALSNWKRLFRSLMIRERLKEKYHSESDNAEKVHFLQMN